MGEMAAKEGDHIIAVDTHIVLVPSPGGPIPTPLPNPFDGLINGNLSTDVRIMGLFAATVGSTAENIPPHIPEEGTFEVPPTDQGEIITGSESVMINGRPAARNGDTAMTCNDPVDLPVGRVIAEGTVLIG
jgi:uncharacterized Zn-binding protein involved in type VI secretion